MFFSKYWIWRKNTHPPNFQLICTCLLNSPCISIYLGGHTKWFTVLYIYRIVELQKQKLIITLMDTDKKENKISSYIRKFSMEQLQSHIRGNICAIPHTYIGKPFLIYVFATAPTLNFLKYEENFILFILYIFLYQSTIILKLLLNTIRALLQTLSWRRLAHALTTVLLQEIDQGLYTLPPGLYTHSHPPWPFKTFYGTYHSLH
jgi:hypothetical protein